MQGSFWALPISSLIQRQRFVCSIQKLRISSLGFAKVKSPLLGCEKEVLLKSSLKSFSFAHCIQFLLEMTAGSTRHGLLFSPLEIPVDLMQTKPMITGDIGFRLQYILGATRR